MKKCLFPCLIVLLFSGVSTAQELPVDSESKKITYTEVVDVPGVKKEDLYARGATWFAKSYGSSKAVLQLSDKEEGSLIGKALTEVSFNNPPMGSRYGGVVNYTISMQVKDGKYKYTITDFYHDSGIDTMITSGGPLENEKKPKGGTLKGLSGQGGFPTQKQWEQIKDNTGQNMIALIESLKKAMTKSSSDF